MDEVLDGMAVCAGGGGLELGIKLALGERYRCRVYVERETVAAGVLVKGMETGTLDTTPIWDDFNTFPNREWRGLVDIISAGIPCQPFSVAGSRRGTDDPRNGWPALSRMVFDIAPSIVFVENVASADLLWYYYSEIRPCFHAMGYSTAEGIFTAEEVGAPHLRERLYFMAYRSIARDRGLPVRRRRSHEAARDALGSGTELAYAYRGAGSAEHEQQHGERADQPGRSRVEMAAADIIREQVPIAGQQSAVKIPHADRVVMGDTDGERRSEAECRQASYSRPFPPGPNDREAWAEWLREWPGTEPSIRRDSDGLAFRAHRLHVLGNGVVPVVAAKAFICLASKFGLSI